MPHEQIQNDDADSEYILHVDEGPVQYGAAPVEGHQAVMKRIKNKGSAGDTAPSVGSGPQVAGGSN